MDCLRSFVISSNLNQSFALGPNLDVWTIGTNNYWFGRTIGANADFNIQGFKNINIFGIDVVGDFKSGPGGTQVLIDNWEVNVDLIGQASLIGGEVDPIGNIYNVNTDNFFTNSFVLSKYKRGFELSSPIQSVTQIRFSGYTASGHANQSLLSVTVNWKLNYIFYYKYEGE
jgi:hypothetical protein